MHIIKHSTRGECNENNTEHRSRIAEQCSKIDRNQRKNIPCPAWASGTDSKRKCQEAGYVGWHREGLEDDTPEESGR